jgi:hypothetical protein
MPHEEQATAAKRISSLLEHDAHLLILENISDRAPHVFPNSIGGWIKLFESEGLKALAIQPYDYSPVLRAYAQARQKLRRAKPSSTTPTGHLQAPERFGMVDRTIPSTARRAAYVSACLVDSVLDPVLGRVHAPFPTAHVAILFRKVR